ncbi:hypothetical protein D3C81_2005860 [compost metagenome]
MLGRVASGIDQIDQVAIDRWRNFNPGNGAARCEHHLLGQALRRLVRVSGLLFLAAHQA